MDEFRSAISDSNQRFHVNGSENMRVTDQARVSREDSWRAGYQDHLVCSECGGEEEGGGVASSTSQRADSSIPRPAYEAADDRDNSVLDHRFDIFSNTLNARRSQRVRI